MALATLLHGKGSLAFALTGQAAHSADAAGTVGYIQNPEDCAIIVTNCVCYGITNSTGAANLTVGNAATVAGAHDRTDLFAAAAQAASAGTAVTGFANGDAADALPVVPADDYICAFGSASTAGYTGVCYIEYVRV
jgi:hypothetical protein